MVRGNMGWGSHWRRSGLPCPRWRDVAVAAALSTNTARPPPFGRLDWPVHDAILPLESTHARTTPRAPADARLRGAVGLHRHPRQADLAAGAGAGVVAHVVSQRGAG